MACTPDGELAGSISGGCIEEDFLNQLQDGSLKRQYDERGVPFVVRYGVTAEEVTRLRLPCGGQLHVLLEWIPPEADSRRTFASLDEALGAHRRVSRIVDLSDGRITHRDGAEETVVQLDRQRLVHGLSPRYRLLLLGAGDVACYVAQMALALDYEVTLCDPRPAYLENWNLPEIETTPDMPDDVVRDRFCDPCSGIVALAHDPRVDDMALMEALTTDAFYIGAMGSDRTSAARLERLSELGLTEEQLKRLHAPIGYPIGSKTPAEIAIAIMAEITAVRHGRRG